eukprot:SAG31_NODE_544_length_14245_cov_68.376644_6_plen_81_part_00
MQSAGRASGVAVALCWVIIKLIASMASASENASQNAQVITYFTVAALVSVTCIGAFVALRKVRECVDRSDHIFEATLVAS